MKTRNFLLIIAGLTLVFLLKDIPLNGSTFGKVSDHHVYLAFGFHMNMYHSYRVDRNDEAGFGKDIRIVRGIIDSLDRANNRGAPVRAVWDMDNLFTLETVLPEYAPDIIDNLKRRVAGGGDEVILMSYNNALASALNRQEFATSIERAISNDAGSGVQDVFGTYSPIVRPQEMMTGPGNYGLYEDAGIRAMVLFHSAITFDAFRVFSRPLTRAEAFNPVLYRHEKTGEEMIVIPAYNIGDLVENGSLTEMIERLRREQIEGVIDRDVLVFIHFDADDQYWAGYDMPWYTSWMPNVGGLDALIQEAEALDYVRFTTLADYLDGHSPVGRIDFGQDLADGNFNGYNSWAEKASSQIYWTAVERDRRVHETARRVCQVLDIKESPAELTALLHRSYESRLKLLSTTNYGMAAPYVAPGRERVVETEIAKMRDVDDRILEYIQTMGRRYLEAAPRPTPPDGQRLIDSLLVINETDSGKDENGREPGMMLTLDVTQAGINPEEELSIRTAGGRTIIPRIMNSSKTEDGYLSRVRLYVPDRPWQSAKVYHLFSSLRNKMVPDKARAQTYADSRTLQNEFIRISFDDHGRVSGVYNLDRPVLGPDSLLPAVYYNHGNVTRAYRPENIEVIVEQDGSSGIAVLRLTGNLTMPDVSNAEAGQMDYRLTLIAGVPYLFMESALVYPKTSSYVTLSAGHPALARQVDQGWISVAPTELIPTLTADKQHPFRVARKNYLGVESSYDIDYYKRSPKNLNLANINNHITDGYAAVVGREGGVAVAADTALFSSFAFCPLKMEYLPEKDVFHIRMNPFGTYFGPQYDQPTWGSGLGNKTALSVGGQYRSSAPSYNGAGQTFYLMLSFFDGQTVPATTKNDMAAFADPPMIMTGGVVAASRLEHRLPADPHPPGGFLAGSADTTVYFSWDPSPGEVESYEIQCRQIGGRSTKVWSTPHASLEVNDLDQGKVYTARVVSVGPDGRKSPPSEELTFTAGQPFPSPPVCLPVYLQARLMLAELF